MLFKDKCAVVTGASTGIGRAIAVEFAREGAFVVLVARRQDKLREIKDMIEAGNGSAKVLACDLSKLDAIDGLIDAVKKETDHVDILANVAGVWHGNDEVYAGMDYDKFSRDVILDTYTVGITAPSLLAHALIPLMPSGSSILNISGTFSSGGKGWLPYYVSKRTIEDLTVGLAQELEGKGIRANCISPSDTATEEYGKYFPECIDEAMEPEEIAKYASYLCSDKAEGTTGSVIVMKKGEKPFEGFHK